MNTRTSLLLATLLTNNNEYSGFYFGDEMVNEPFVLFTYTDKVGEIPSIVSKFLENNHKNLVAVIGSGSMERHADTFNFGAKKVSEKYGVELVRCIDLSGTSEDVKAIKEFLNQ
jgi:protein involved in ribonucleotide reduction